MSEGNKTVVRKLYDVIREGDLEALAAMLADDMVEHEELPGLEPNKDGVIQFFRGMREAFPDLAMDVDDLIAEGDRVFVRATMKGTHRGAFMGIPATGSNVEVPLADFFRIRDGKVAEHWGITDTEAMMRQLGVVES